MRAALGWGLLLALAAAAACGADDTPCDCPGPVYECRDGLARAYCSCGNPPLPVRCRLGCGANANNVVRLPGNTCLVSLCREAEPKTVGDPCSEDLDCLPAPPTGDPPNLMNTYLSCDLASGTCAAGEMPLVVDWLAPCDPNVLASIARTGSHQAGSRADPSCGGGLCAFSIDGDGACVRNGCTRKCAHSGECPTGATCLVGEGWDPTLSCAAPALAPDGYCAPRSDSPPLFCQPR